DTISVWQTELLLGTISDDDKASLTEWMAYIKALQVVDTSDPESITWPTEPTIS
ncbi:TPA: tail fiber assembly protein, partial [Klebsiella pneumoniae]|nr:tail fiber assembly protein [Klebsiella pneumoniae]